MTCSHLKNIELFINHLKEDKIVYFKTWLKCKLNSTPDIFTYQEKSAYFQINCKKCNVSQLFNVYNLVLQEGS